MIRIVAGQFRKRVLKTPPSSTRPTTDRVRESVFNILTHTFGVNFNETLILDAFAGSGALGFEALSRGAPFVHFCEKNGIAQQVLLENIKLLKVEGQCRLWGQDALQLPQAERPMGLVFLDPPYYENLLKPVGKHLKLHGWVDPETLVYAETADENLPRDMEGFQVLEQRIYGKCVASFLRLE